MKENYQTELIKCFDSLHQDRQHLTVSNERRFRLNMEKVFPINKTPHGVYNSQKKLEKIVNIHFNQLKLTLNNIQIKIRTDGANIGKKRNRSI